MQTVSARGLLGLAIIPIGYAYGASSSMPGASSYVAPANFPTSVFASYYLLPTQPTAEPQPILYDPILDLTYPYNLTNPDTIPTVDNDPVYYPVPSEQLTAAQAQNFLAEIFTNVTNVIRDGANGTTSNCTICKNALAAAKPAALTVPSLVPNAMVQFCELYKFHSNATCQVDFAATNDGAIWTQILAFADVEGEDGKYICNSLSSTFCPKPYAIPQKPVFPKPKPANACAPQASGKRVKVLHMSDMHLDPRYAVGAEGNCTSNLCCRANNPNPNVQGISLPATPYGSFECDSPYDLALAALESVGPLTGTGKSTESLGWTIYTGDLTSHDPQNQLSQLYNEYAEYSIYTMLKYFLTGPVFAALGNHDTSPVAMDAPHALPGNLSTQFSWNYNHVAGLWLHEGWISPKAAAEARAHYGGYSVKNHFGLRIISFNTDFWYHSNFLTYINATDGDNSGVFSWMIEELQAAEDAGERVWIIGHVLSGWDGTNPIPNPTDFFYQIVERYSPHVIANIFWGHTHEDFFFLYYANNATNIGESTALNTAWVGPSITPLTNLNSGYRLYEVDTGDFSIYDAYTFYANVSAFAALNNTNQGPTFHYEYSTRETYGAAANWPSNAPLNATFWHRVTEAMASNLTLVTLQNTLQGKMSVKTPNCTNTACQAARVCYMRSGSYALGQTCPQG